MSSRSVQGTTSNESRGQARREHLYALLTRHFFGRFFDTESLSPQGDPQANVNQTLGILAVPSAFFILVFRPLGLYGWQLVGVRYLFLSLSMLLMGFVMVFEWDALFPDRRDYQILTPMPLKLSALFFTKVLALGAFLGIFLIDVNFFGVIFWPAIDSRGHLPQMWMAHLVTMLVSGLFAALSIAALQGVLITILPGKAYRRVSAALQTLLMGLLVMLLFLTPLIGFSLERLVKTHDPLRYCYPPFWFAGLYERLHPATHSPELQELGTAAIRALAGVTVLFLLTYLPLYRRHARKILETPQPSPTGPGRVTRWISHAVDRHILRHPIETAVFHFIGQTITRSVKHRLFLATYGGFGAALAVMTLTSGHSGLVRLSLTLSFVLVSGLRAAFNFPSELAANWAFQIAETSHVHHYLEATRKWVALCAVVPLFALLAPVEFTYFPSSAAVFHLLYGLVLTLVLTEIMFFGFHKVPFTCSHFPGKVNLVGLSVVYVLGFTMYSGTMADLELWLMRTPAAAAAFFVTMVACCLGLSYWRRRESGEAILDYDDPGDPVVQTLNLTSQ